ncbi:hypothetical protein BKA67DRAFT_647076 [Truncatella angustata]|uniref:Uncharacterized protein n=1 Tax=Truncatella angustata TaxID=152316 RepID=A0A9P8ZVZ5_9PEZI|nr:uncharacterized protein BKA67DRAFT_647076 [Truncatella angustata]KAH6653100.1 hypothetical protein BKA67DRAFT_647076 [Truncatella angustata]KAH8195332.1 hypothetical protein TruAng_010500 [Truncatella angustata]
MGSISAEEPVNGQVNGKTTAVAGLKSFPTTRPAIRIKCGLSGQFPCGSIYTGSTLVGVPLSWGTLESVGDFEPKLNLKLTNGHDWFRIDADKQHGRLSVSAIATDEEGRSIRLIADGVTELNEYTMPLILGDPNAKTNPFGYGVEQMRFEAGHDVYKPLENMMFACSQRFAKDDETGAPMAEIRVSQIVPGSGFE